MQIYNEYLNFVKNATITNENILLKLDKMLFEISRYNSLESGEVMELPALAEMDELIKKVEGLDGQKKYIEEFLEGEYFDLYCLWDGKSLACFNSPTPTNEVKEDRLYLLKTKLSFMFSDEKADFTGLFKVKLIWAKNDWYVREFIMGIDSEDDIKSSLEKTNKDFLYILDSAIYQKLNELG